MNKNTIIGFALIAVIFIGFSILTEPSAEEKLQIQRKYDSIALLKKENRFSSIELKSIKKTAVGYDFILSLNKFK